MSEWVVRWKHWRYPVFVDGYYRWWATGRMTAGSVNRCMHTETLRTMREFQREGRASATHGGMTECRVYEDYSEVGGPLHPEPLVVGVAVCSWRDQFDRRVGRLYSLALALCELPNLTLDDLDLWDALGIQTCDYCKPYRFEQLCGYIILKDKHIVKRICAEIVASWKPKRNRTAPTKREDANAGYRPFSPSLQVKGEDGGCPSGHPASAIVRGEYWGKDEQGRENYTWYCGVCSDEARRQGEGAEHDAA